MAYSTPPGPGLTSGTGVPDRMWRVSPSALIPGRSKAWQGPSDCPPQAWETRGARGKPSKNPQQLTMTEECQTLVLNIFASDLRTIAKLQKTGGLQ